MACRKCGAAIAPFGFNGIEVCRRCGPAADDWLRRTSSRTLPRLFPAGEYPVEPDLDGRGPGADASDAES